MNNFFKVFLASTLGALVAGMLVFLFSILMISSMISSATEEKKTEVKEGSILKLDFNSQIAERDEPSPLPLGEAGPLFNAADKVGLYEITKAIRAAKEDENIKGIYLNCDLVLGGWASVESIREELANFKESGKFVYAYSEIYTEKAYYLATVADKIFLYPYGGMEFNGLASTPWFVRGMFDKLGIEPKVFRVGTFKAAVEPFINQEMSDANELQTQQLLEDIWQQFIIRVSESRGISLEELQRIANEGVIEEPDDAKAFGLVDELYYEDQVLDLLMEETGKKKSTELEFLSLSKYLKADIEPESKNTDNKIAIIFAEGEIVDGKGGSENIGGDKYAEILRKVREDSTIKAVVLRVNSPGGSALASDVMFRELTLLKKEKPVVCSMGDVAASGGYYIAAPCDYIYAQPNTITGSIGVFGMLFNSEKFFNEKLGITFDRVVTNPYADIGNPNRQMTELEEQKIQNGVNRVYSRFIKVVETGRGYPDSLAVDSLAQGRVWSGTMALKIGLVDELGDLDDAIKHAAKLAGLDEDDYKFRQYPQKTDPFEELMKKFTEGQVKAIEQEYGIPQDLKMMKHLQQMTGRDNILMLMPYTYDIN